MTDAPRQPGPWEEAEGLRPGAPAPAAAAEPTTAGSGRTKEIVWALISSALIALWLGWRMGPVVAVAGVFGILVHELGHLFAINRLGCGPGKIHFIPFLGGAATAKRASPTEWIDVLIALAGPAVGIFAALPFFAAWAVTRQAMWLDGAIFIAVINLLNLAPAPPLDGSKALGPALARLHPQVERVALVLVGGLAILWAVERNAVFLAVFMGFGLFLTLRSARMRPQAVKLDGRQQAAAFTLWLATAGLCVGTLYAAFRLAGGRSDLLTLLGSI
ncbi:metalloprotease [Caulobacter sp. 17J80-11]|uniref:metalloprotease n=1 Tax=Caulobacter sp. 17J80-11 TaxID=2763502 RepID=UPI001653DBA2|nr:peptidase M50 [Caulobacter sp. 17J80-11]MBC6980466.1 peptidase M50 [Caulobacter sp. 17J80-11]